ncbi:MAG: magnesium chelatase subunit D [Pseudomonadota bacterium]
MTPWQRAELALNLLAIDPVGLGGITVRSRMSPARSLFATACAGLSQNSTKLHPKLAADALDGGIDIAATLERGRLTHHTGIMDRKDQVFLLNMAERTDPYLATRLCAALDASNLRGLIAFDEGAEEDEHLPAGLADRLAFHLNFDGLSQADIKQPLKLRPNGKTTNIDIPDDLPEQLVVLAVKLGIASLRAPSFALRAAKAHAALFGRNRVEETDITAALELVYAHRATQLPQEDDAPPPPPENEGTDRREHDDVTQDIAIPSEILLDAVLAALPDGLLKQLNSGKATSGKGAGSGQKIVGNRRGRPLPARRNSAKSDARIDLIATLRTAVPWQTLRKAAQPERKGPIIRPTDLCRKRYEDLSDRLLVFAVDASGSAAASRLGEAKGAVELLLADAYARRDHVALIAFRGTQADVLLPPTRSLVQTKRRLAALPGGGGTPLACGLQSALMMCIAARRKGQTPTLVLITDGRGNVALDGEADRMQAQQDAMMIAHQIAAQRIDAIVIDAGNRPERSLKALSSEMRGHYVALPRADAKRLSEAVSASLRA